VGFIARLRPDRFPGSGARKLPSSTNNLLEWVLPPLVTFAVEAHTRTPYHGSLSEWGVSMRLTVYLRGVFPSQGPKPGIPSNLSGLLNAIDDDELDRAFRRFQLQPKLLTYRVQKRRARQVGIHAVGRDDC